MLHDAELPAYLVAATAGGIFAPEHHELTRPLVPDWFAGIGRTAELRSGWGLTSIVKAGFPHSHADPAMLALARAALADPGLDAALARALADATDQAEHAVSAIAATNV